MKHLIQPVFAFLSAASFVSPVCADELRGSWDFSLDVYAESDDNVNHGTDAYRLDDTVTGVVLGIERDIPFSYNNALIYSFELGYESYSDWDGLNHAIAGAGLEYRFRSGRHFTAPVYSLYAKIRALEFDSKVRDGGETLIGFSLGKRVTDRVQLVFGLEAYQRNADTEVFQLSRNRFYGLFDWRVGYRTSVYLQYQYLKGDIASTGPMGAYTGLGGAVPYIEDDAFYFQVPAGQAQTQPGSGYYGTPTYTYDVVPAYAYRLDSKTQVIEVGINLPLNNAQAFQLSVSNYDSDAQYNLKYGGTQIRLDYLVRF